MCIKKIYVIISRIFLINIFFNQCLKWEHTWSDKILSQARDVIILYQMWIDMFFLHI